MVGEQIRRLREEKGWSQAQLAVYAGMAPGGVNQIENGKRNANSVSLMKIAGALGVEMGDLFPKAEAPTSPPPAEDEERRERDLDAIAVIQRATKRGEELEETLKAQGPSIPMNAMPFLDTHLAAD